MTDTKALLENILSGEGKTRAAVTLVMAGQEIEPEYIQPAVDYLAAQEDYSTAAEVARRGNMPEQSRKYFLKASESAQAIGNYLQAGVYSIMACDSEQAIDCFAKADVKQSSRLSELVKDPETLQKAHEAQLIGFERQGKFHDCAVLALQMGEMDRAKAYNSLQVPKAYETSNAGEYLITGGVVGVSLAALIAVASLVAGTVFPPALAVATSFFPPLAAGLSGTTTVLFAAADRSIASDCKDPWYRFLYEQNRTELYERPA